MVDQHDAGALAALDRLARFGRLGVGGAGAVRVMLAAISPSATPEPLPSRPTLYEEVSVASIVVVTVKHQLHGAAGLAIEEEQDIVYRDASAGSAPSQSPPHGKAEWEREVRPSEALLFRYSALIFNAHRIHYDLRYCTQVEGYPGLVVHGPLIATYLMELARDKSGSRLAAFSYRGVSPLFDTAPFHVCGQPSADGRSAELWAEAAQGALAMTAKAEFA
mgnify:CR=1 FL=1